MQVKKNKISNLDNFDNLNMGSSSFNKVNEGSVGPNFDIKYIIII